MNLLIIYHDHHAINYNKMLIINAFKTNRQFLVNNNINCEFFEIKEIDDFKKIDMSKYKNYTFWLHQKYGSYIVTVPEYLKLIKSNNIKTIFWMDDLHFPCMNLENEERLENKVIELDERYVNVDMIVTPSINYFRNINSILLEKSKFLFYFFDENLIDMFNPKNNYNSRTSKILLSGKINSLSYPSRKQMYTNYFNNKDIFDWLEHPGYNNLKHNVYHLEYYKKLASYKGAIVGLAKFPLNFLLAKVIEVLGSGCLGFFEASTLYKERLGLEEYIHYIPIEFDENNKLKFLNYEYRYILDSKEGLEIAMNGYNYIKNNFNSKTFIKNVINIL
jgi:hypothetical protein